MAAEGLEPNMRSKLDKYIIRDETMWSPYNKLEKHSLIYSVNLNIRITLQPDSNEMTPQTPPRCSSQTRVAIAQPFRYRREYWMHRESPSDIPLAIFSYVVPFLLLCMTPQMPTIILLSALPVDLL